MYIFFRLATVAVFSTGVSAGPTHHRVRRGHGGYGTSLGAGNTVVDSISVGAISGGANQFSWQYGASQNFLASAGRSNYLQQQGGLQSAAWAGAGAANAGFGYDATATGKHLPSNLAGYNGFPSYGRWNYHFLPAPHVIDLNALEYISNDHESFWSFLIEA